jgi:hypothetical protein
LRRSHDSVYLSMYRWPGFEIHTSTIERPLARDRFEDVLQNAGLCYTEARTKERLPGYCCWMRIHCTWLILILVPESVIGWPKPFPPVMIRTGMV